MQLKCIQQTHNEAKTVNQERDANDNDNTIDKTQSHKKGADQLSDLSNEIIDFNIDLVEWRTSLERVRAWIQIINMELLASLEQVHAKEIHDVE
eukprot:491479-Ditylum_brightwellii.AAC.2